MGYLKQQNVAKWFLAVAVFPATIPNIAVKNATLIIRET